MPAPTPDRIAATFFACGWVKEPAAPAIREKLRLLDDRVQTVSLGDYGHFFYTTPAYADVADSDDMVWIKLGHVHDGERMLSTEDMIQRGWLARDNVRAEAIKGSTTLIGFNKREPTCLIYRNLISSATACYWNSPEAFLVTDNLRLMIELLPDPQLNEDMLVQHFIHRYLFSASTYVRDVSELLVGEQLTWSDGALAVDLCRDIRAYATPERVYPVTSDTVNMFFEQLKNVLNMYLKDHTHVSATMLSGGVDSMLLHAAINGLPEIDFAFPAFSYMVETPFFGYEAAYAQDAAEVLRTNQTFVKIEPAAYPDSLIQCTEILGRPVQDDVRPFHYLLTQHIGREASSERLVINGLVADTLFGEPDSLKIIQGDKYRKWPIPILKVLGALLTPISQSKSFGAISATETLLGSKDEHSLTNYLNEYAVYTDWESVQSCFPQAAIQAALAEKRSFVARYIDSDFMVEKLHIVGTAIDAGDIISTVRQLDRYCGNTAIFPYADETIVQAAFAFDPMQRYIHDHRAKPILKMALESQVQTAVTHSMKGWSGIGDDLWVWFRQGVLHDLVHDIDRPGFMVRADFERKIAQPDWFTWSLLTLDLFKKYALKQ